MSYPASPIPPLVFSTFWLKVKQYLKRCAKIVQNGKIYNLQFEFESKLRGQKRSVGNWMCLYLEKQKDFDFLQKEEGIIAQNNEKLPKHISHMKPKL